LADAKPAAPAAKPASPAAKPAPPKPGGGGKGGGKGGKGKGPAKPGGGKRLLYQIEGQSVKRLRRACPKCGPGMFLADHANRFSCGNCGYTEFKK
jgi:small subunit ribosomal protein S27Ae